MEDLSRQKRHSQEPGIVPSTYVPALRKLRSLDCCGLEAILAYSVRPVFKNIKNIFKKLKTKQK